MELSTRGGRTGRSRPVVLLAAVVAVTAALVAVAFPAGAVKTANVPDTPVYSRGQIIGNYTWCDGVGREAVVYMQYKSASGGGWKTMSASKHIQAVCAFGDEVSGSFIYPCRSGKNSYRTQLYFIPPGVNQVVYYTSGTLTKTC